MRRHYPPNYSSRTPVHITKPGVIRTETVDKIDQTWAVSRPMMSPEPNGAPYYLSTYPMPAHTDNRLIQSGTMTLTPPRYRIEMDPSDVKTWQRAYLFPV